MSTYKRSDGGFNIQVFFFLTKNLSTLKMALYNNNNIWARRDFRKSPGLTRHNKKIEYKRTEPFDIGIEFPTSQLFNV